MTTYAEARRVIGASLKNSGLVGRGSVWRLSGSDVQWLAQIDQARFASWVNVDIGLELGLDMTPHRAADCAVVVALENLGLVDDLSLRMALSSAPLWLTRIAGEYLMKPPRLSLLSSVAMAPSHWSRRLIVQGTFRRVSFVGTRVRLSRTARGEGSRVKRSGLSR